MLTSRKMYCRVQEKLYDEHVSACEATAWACRLHGGYTAATRRLQRALTAFFCWAWRLHGGYTAVTRRLHATASLQRALTAFFCLSRSAFEIARKRIAAHTHVRMIAVD